MVIVWSERARREFDQAVAYIKQRSQQGARRTAHRIEKRIDDLLLFPDQGTPARNGLRRLVVTGTRYIVIYSVAPKNITIVAVLHAARRRRS